MPHTGAGQKNKAKTVVIVGGVLTAIAAFLPWITITIPFGGEISRSGIDGGGDGWIVLGLGGVTALSALWGSLGSGKRALWYVLGGAAIVVSILDISSVNERIDTIEPEYRHLAGVGFGLYLTAIGGITIIVGAVMQRSRESEAAARLPPAERQRIAVEIAANKRKNRKRNIVVAGLVIGIPLVAGGIVLAYKLLQANREEQQQLARDCEWYTNRAIRILKTAAHDACQCPDIACATVALNRGNTEVDATPVACNKPTEKQAQAMQAQRAEVEGCVESKRVPPATVVTPIAPAPP